MSIYWVVYPGCIKRRISLSCCRSLRLMKRFTFLLLTRAKLSALNDFFSASTTLSVVITSTVASLIYMRELISLTLPDK